MSIALEIVSPRVDWPAWFQAIGSVAAVLAAIWTAWIAVRQTKLAAAAETVRLVELVCSIGYQIADACDVAYDQLRNGKAFPEENFDSVLRLFEAYPVDKYPSAELALRLAGIHRLALGFRLTVTEVAASNALSDYIADMVGSARVSVPEHLYEEVEGIGAEYDGLVTAGQRILDGLPGKRRIMAVGRAHS